MAGIEKPPQRRWMHRATPLCATIDGLMFARLSMLGLTIWVAASALRIEYLNAEAGYVLPRQEDGKWRISLQNTPSDQLRELVRSVGLAQYLLAPLLIALAAYHFLRGESDTHCWLALAGGVVGLTALGLAFCRGYFSSLGW